MKPLIFIILVICTVETYSQTSLFSKSIEFVENRADTINIKLDSILIIGMGTSVARVFEGDLSSKLIKDLEEKKIFAAYSFLSNNAKRAKKQYDSLDKKGFKAILILHPKDTGVFDTKYNTSIYFGDYFNSSTTTAEIVYQQTFEIKIFAMVPEVRLFWKATIDVDCDPSKAVIAKRIARKIIKELEIHKYLD